MTGISQRPSEKWSSAPRRRRPTNTYSRTVAAYSRAGMIVDAVNRVSRAVVFVRNTSVISAPRTAARSVAQVGQPVVPGHGPDHPAVRDHDHHAAREDRDADEDQEDLLHHAAEHVVDDERDRRAARARGLD